MPVDLRGRHQSVRPAKCVALPEACFDHSAVPLGQVCQGLRTIDSLLWKLVQCVVRVAGSQYERGLSLRKKQQFVRPPAYLQLHICICRSARKDNFEAARSRFINFYRLTHHRVVVTDDVMIGTVGCFEPAIATFRPVHDARRNYRVGLGQNDAQPIDHRRAAEGIYSPAVFGIDAVRFQGNKLPGCVRSALHIHAHNLRQVPFVWQAFPADAQEIEITAAQYDAPLLDAFRVLAQVGDHGRAHGYPLLQVIAAVDHDLAHETGLYLAPDQVYRGDDAVALPCVEDVGNQPLAPVRRQQSPEIDFESCAVALAFERQSVIVGAAFRFIKRQHRQRIALFD